MAEKSKLLVIGANSYIGKFIVEASVKLGHPTFVLVRESTVFELFSTAHNDGAILIHGDINDHESLVKAIKDVDVVISAVESLQEVPDQVKIIDAIREAGNVKRFLPSEFGTDVDRSQPVEPAATFFQQKVDIRRAIEAAGIPYTYIVSYGFARFFLPTLGQENADAPPRDKVVIRGDGNPKVIVVAEEDVATYTIKAVDDPRTLNQTLYIRPPANILSFNEIVSLWENKIGITLERIYVPEHELLENIEEAASPMNYLLAADHSALVRGDAENYDPSFGVEATEIYPEVEYITVDQFLDGMMFRDATASSSTASSSTKCYCF